MITEIINENKLTSALFAVLSEPKNVLPGLPINAFIATNIKTIETFINTGGKGKSDFSFTPAEGQPFYSELVLNQQEKIIVINFYGVVCHESPDGKEHEEDVVIATYKIDYAPLMKFTITGTDIDITDEILGTVINNRK